MMQELYGALGRLGLKKNDAKIYLACLKARGGLYVHEIVSETKIHRSTVDLILLRLQSGGYVTRTRVGSRDKYSSQEPEAIIQRQEQALADLKALSPLMVGLRGNAGETEVHFFEGAEGIRQIYDDILLQLKKEKGERRSLLSFSSGIHAIKAYPAMGRSFIANRIALGVWYKAVTPLSSSSVKEWSNDAASLRAVKFVDDKKFSFKTSMEIYGDNVMILSTTKPLGGVVIRNVRIADSLRSLFYLVWDILPD